MSMTGNHRAMSTANTVYLKHRETATNVSIEPIFTSVKQEECSTAASSLLMTSSIMPLEDLHKQVALLKDNLSWSLASLSTSLYDPCVIYTSTSWKKTLGLTLPSVDL